ncbi:MAG: hypothetical protein H6696_14750 [Deferribacteres bacterium]|nr:hypothetical protein [candidate division KSB1 bacterium]MCB9503187.1 hypothetical protein [Deferribacteres bacterium]
MQAMIDDYQYKLDKALNSASTEFQLAYQLMNTGRLDEALRYFSACVQNGINEGDSLSLGAACWHYLGNSQMALEGAQAVSNRKDLSTIGTHYYYFTIVGANDNLNNFDQAVYHAREAIEYFGKVGSSLNIALFLRLKANILKQMASLLSHDIQTLEKAKVLISEAITAIIESLELLSPEKSEVEFLEKEIEIIVNIAGRSCLSFEELELTKNPKNIHPMLWPFNKDWLAQKSALMLWNEAVKAIKVGNYEYAFDWIEIAIRRTPLSPAFYRGFKMYILYKYGVYLLKHHGFKNLPEAIKIQEGSYVSKKTRQIWADALQLYITLSEDDIAEFAQKFEEPLDTFAAKISQDFMFSGFGHEYKDLIDKAFQK